MAEQRSKTEKVDSAQPKLRRDHVKVLQVLADDLPKRTPFKMKDIAKAKFKDGPNITADRLARNSVRKPRELGFVEICERGEYRLTSAGVAFCKNLDSYTPAPDMDRGEKTTTKPAKKVVAKAAKKIVAKAPKKAEKKPVKKAAKTKTAKSLKAMPEAKADLDMPSDDEDRPNGKSTAKADTDPTVPVSESPEGEELTQ